MADRTWDPFPLFSIEIGANRVSLPNDRQIENMRIELRRLEAEATELEADPLNQSLAKVARMTATESSKALERTISLCETYRSRAKVKDVRIAVPPFSALVRAEEAAKTWTSDGSPRIDRTKMMLPLLAGSVMVDGRVLGSLEIDAELKPDEIPPLFEEVYARSFPDSSRLAFLDLGAL